MLYHKELCDLLPQKAVGLILVITSSYGDILPPVCAHAPLERNEKRMRLEVKMQRKRNYMH